MPAGQHIYFLVHASHQRFKVGTAVDPLRRWAQIQPHDQTDFTESIVFDLDPEVPVSWAERTFHQALRHARLDMPRDTDGYSEWFDYSALESAHAFAVEQRELLRIGAGYPITLPEPATQAAPARGQTKRSRQGGFVSFPDDPAPLNNTTAQRVEEQIERWLGSGALIGATAHADGLRVYFDQDLITHDQASPDRCTLYSALTGPSGPVMRGSREIFSDVAATGTHIRITVNDPFGSSESFETMVHPGCLDRGRAETWEETTPGAERVRMAMRRLPAADASFDAAAVDVEIDTFWAQFAQGWE